jgi:PilZ domain
MRQQFQIPNRRGHERVSIAMPMFMAGKTGVTRDVSVSGVYFEIDGAAAIGSEVSFEIEMDTATLGLTKVKCSGQVVRKEQQGSRTGIAVTMTDSRLEVVQ